MKIKLCLGMVAVALSSLLGCDPGVDRCAVQCMTDYDCRADGSIAARMCSDALDRCLTGCDGPQDDIE